MSPGCRARIAPSPVPTRRSRPVAYALTRRWILAGLIGLTVAATLGARPPLDLPPPLVAIVGIMAGWITMLVVAPWRETTTLVGQDEAIDRFAADLRKINDGHRERRLQDLLTETDSALGPLAEAIHDALADSMASQRQTRMLKRTMRDPWQL